MDKSKAFDKVWDEGLIFKVWDEGFIFKLKSVGISNTLLELIKKFLEKQVSESCFKWPDVRVNKGKSRCTKRIYIRSSYFPNLH